MKDLKNILEECSINDIYFSNSGVSILYKIPIYQRNYAWGREEIYALIKDVHDSLEKSVYYIGTLVTYKRDENIFEVIDGSATTYNNLHHLEGFGHRNYCKLSYIFCKKGFSYDNRKDA